MLESMVPFVGRFMMVALICVVGAVTIDDFTEKKKTNKKKKKKKKST